MILKKYGRNPQYWKDFITIPLPQRRFTLRCFFPKRHLFDESNWSIFSVLNMSIYRTSCRSTVVLYKFTSLFCEAYTHGLNCGFNITDPNFHKSKPLQHLNFVYKHIVSGTCFSSHGSSPVCQKTLKSSIQSLQTSTTVGLCWDLDLWLSFLKTWFPCVYSG